MSIHETNIQVTLTRESIAKVLDQSGLLLLTNLLVLLLVSGSFQALPGEPSAKEVHENVTQSLQVVSSRLLTTKMGVDAHVTGGSRETLSLSVGDVLLRLGVAVLLGHAEVDYMNDVGSLGLRATNQEVVGLDVAVDEVLLVDSLHSRQLIVILALNNTMHPAMLTICLATITTVLILNRRLQ